MRSLRQITTDIQQLKKQQDALYKQEKKLYAEQRAVLDATRAARVENKFSADSKYVILEAPGYHNNIISLYELKTFTKKYSIVKVTQLRADDGDYFTVIRYHNFDYLDFDNIRNAVKVTTKTFNKISEIILNPMITDINDKLKEIEELVK